MLCEILPHTALCQYWSLQRHTVLKCDRQTNRQTKEELSLCVCKLMPVTKEREKFYTYSLFITNSNYISRVQNFERKNEVFKCFGFILAY